MERKDIIRKDGENFKELFAVRIEHSFCAAHIIVGTIDGIV
jgi:hypothetical protein